MSISLEISESIKNSSWIRAMFEAGIKLKKEKGAENVFDFSLGNPNISPPKTFFKILKKLAKDETPGNHSYMPNAGYPFVRERIAKFLSQKNQLNFSSEDIIMTVGAGGGLNVIIKTILNKGFNIVIPTPYFVEYDFYLKNHGGSVNRVPCKKDFSLNIEAIYNSINDKTCAILINSPNNPTGKVYNEKELKKLSEMLSILNEKRKYPLYLISDEPYRDIIFDNTIVPSLFNIYQHSIIVTSFSKNLNLPGERIGYIAVHPEIVNKHELIAGMTLSNRILGFVNAPAFMQRAISELLEDKVDIKKYSYKRKLILEILKNSDFEFTKPSGGFYVFPKSPIEDDVLFVKNAIKENLLLVPGSGFMGPGYFRIAFCCSDETIIRSAEAFKKIRSYF